MKKLRLLLLASGLALLLPVAAYTQSVSDFADLGPEERRAYMETLSPDERAAARDKRRDRKHAGKGNRDRHNSEKNDQAE